MLLTPEQLERACGFLLLNEFNAFSYCCKTCPSEFESGPELEAHVLDHQDVKTGFESVFVPPSDVCEEIEPWNDADQQQMTIDEIKNEIKVEPLPVQDEPYGYEHSYRSTSDNGSFGIFGSEDDYDTMVRNVSSEKNVTEKNAIEKSAKGKSTIKKSATEKCYFKSQSTEKQTKRSKKYYCDMCPVDKVNFTRKVDIQQHLLRDHVKAWKPCPICKEMTAYLPSHIKAQHPGITKPYQCTYCPSAFKAESAFHIHVRSHTGERPYLCNLCGERFTMASVLAIHIDRIHKTKEILPYPCTECDLRFRLAQFEKHRLAIHNDSQPHVCTICGAKFKKIAKLRKHNFTHGERTFKCQYCYKTFKTNDYKRLHERNVHENAKKKKRKNTTPNQDSVVNIQSETSEKIEQSNPSADGESIRDNQVLETSMEF